MLAGEIKKQAEDLESHGNTTMLVQQNDQFIGIVTLMDVARKDARATLAELAKKGIRKMIMLTGDNQQVAEAIAKEIGITDAWGNLMPEQKVEAIDRLRVSEKKVISSEVGFAIEGEEEIAERGGAFGFVAVQASEEADADGFGAALRSDEEIARNEKIPSSDARVRQWLAHEAGG